MASNKEILQAWKVQKFDWEKSINEIYSGNVVRNQNSLTSILCTIRIRTEQYRMILKNSTCIMFIVMYRRYETLAIEYFQFILKLWNYKHFCTLYLITFHNSQFLIPDYCGFLHGFVLFLFQQQKIIIPIYWQSKPAVRWHQQYWNINVPVDTSHDVSFALVIWRSGLFQ